MSTRKTLISVLFTALSVMGIAGGCSGGSDDGNSGGNACPYDYGAYSPASDPSFRADVLPIIQRACNLRTCHGTGIVGSRADLYMGPSLSAGPPDDVAINEIFTTMLLVPSTTVGGMPRITPGNPSQSMMMIKIDGCQNDRGLTCTVQSGAVSDTPCGDDMPQSQPALPDREKEIFRDWIAMGAKNN